ncbi:Mu transposase C-terminal domain-containing protein [Craterilacuibacter sinensis]|nr:Mu transposase C-terminal domain-containing protein [Craterilacuibacter sinensis]
MIKSNGGEQYRILASSLPEAAYKKWCQQQLADIGYQVASQLPALRQVNQGELWATDRQKNTAHARLGVVKMVERIMATTQLGKQAAAATLLERAALGQLDEHSMKLLSAARDPRGRGGLLVDGYHLPSARSLWRFMSAARQEVLTGDSSALTPKVPQPDKQIPAWAKAFLTVYQIPSKPSVGAAYEVFKAAWLAQYPIGTLPTVHQVRRYLGKLGKVDCQTGRMLPREIKAMKVFIRRDTSKLWPTDVYSMDGHTFDAEVEHPFHGKPFRPEITTTIDVATRVVVGISAGLKENWMSVASALRHSVMAHGIPSLLYVDNGSGYCNAMLKDEVVGFLGRLGTTPTHSIAYNSQARGMIERVQKTLWVEGLAKRLPTYMGADMDRQAKQMVFKQTRKEIMARGEATTKLLPDWRTFWQMALDEVKSYNNRPHSSLGKIKDQATGKTRHMTPNEAWQKSVAEGFETVTLSREEGILLFMPEEVRVTLRGEISLFSNRYFARDLEQFTGERVRVAFDPYDAERVIVKTMEGRIICEALFEANSRDYFPTTFVEKAARGRAQAREKRLQQQMDEVGLELAAGRALGYQPGQPIPFEMPVSGEREILAYESEMPEQVEQVAIPLPTAPRKTCLPLDQLIDNDVDQYCYLIEHADDWTELDARWLMEYVAGGDYEFIADRYKFFGQAWNKELEDQALAVLQKNNLRTA